MVAIVATAGIGPAQASRAPLARCPRRAEEAGQFGTVGGAALGAQQRARCDPDQIVEMPAMAELRTTPLAAAGIFSWNAHAPRCNVAPAVFSGFQCTRVAQVWLSLSVPALLRSLPATDRLACQPFPYTRSVSPTPNRPRCGSINVPTTLRSWNGVLEVLLEPSIPRSFKRLPIVRSAGRPNRVWSSVA